MCPIGCLGASFSNRKRQEHTEPSSWHRSLKATAVFSPASSAPPEMGPKCCKLNYQRNALIPTEDTDTRATLGLQRATWHLPALHMWGVGKVPDMMSRRAHVGMRWSLRWLLSNWEQITYVTSSKVQGSLQNRDRGQEVHKSQKTGEGLQNVILSP